MPTPRKPKQVKILQGTFRQDRNPANEPTIDPPPKDKMGAPISLNRWGKKFWNDYINVLTNSKILTDADLSAFEMLAQAWGTYKQAEYDIGHDEVTGKKRTMVQYRESRNYSRRSMPEMIELNESRALFSQLSQQFGMTPVARNRIDIPQKQEVDPLSQMYEEQRAQA
jgi:P27 family predicted phage terminase small subunit